MPWIPGAKRKAAFERVMELLIGLLKVSAFVPKSLGDFGRYRVQGTGRTSVTFYPVLCTLYSVLLEFSYLDRAEGNAVAVVLDENVAGWGFPEVGPDFILAIGYEGTVHRCVALVFKHFFVV